MNILQDLTDHLIDMKERLACEQRAIEEQQASLQTLRDEMAIIQRLVDKHTVAEMKAKQGRDK